MDDHEPDGAAHDAPPAANSPRDAADLMPAIYEELRQLAHRYMSREPIGHTLQTTALVHEAYLRMAQQTQSIWNNRTHFYAVASQMVRRVLVDHARTRLAQKRGGSSRKIDGRTPAELARLATDDGTAPVDVLALDEAMKELAELNERQCRVVELRYFGGLSIEETAEALGISIGTVKGDWRIARVWLKRRLQSEANG